MAPKKSLSIQYTDTVMNVVQVGFPITTITTSRHNSITVLVMTWLTDFFTFTKVVVDRPVHGKAFENFIFLTNKTIIC